MSIKTKRIAYRTILIVAALLALLASINCYVAYTINQNYFPHQSHAANLLWMSAYFIAALILFCEAVFLIILRRFT